MNLKKLIAITSVTALGTAYASQPAQAQMASDEVLVNTCFSCHGTDGKSSGDMPTMSGKSASYIFNKMMDFRSGKKPSTVMMRITKGFSDAELKAITNFFAKK